MSSPPAGSRRCGARPARRSGEPRSRGRRRTRVTSAVDLELPPLLAREGGERRRDGVLVTGVTGFVGIELLARYLQLTERPVFVLIRARNDAHADERLRETLRCA